MASTIQASHNSPDPDSYDYDEHASKHGGYLHGNVYCSAPYPPGALCNAESCEKCTEFYVQRWRCTWKKLNLDPLGQECAWTKVWSCSFDSVARAEVLKQLCCKSSQRCTADCDECACLVPEDVYFAKVWEIEYEQCSDHVLSSGEEGFLDDAHPVDSEGDPAGCACCGLKEVLCSRWVKITCKSDIPPAKPFEVQLPCYDWPCKPSGCRKQPALCAGVGCRVGSAAHRSPDFWLAPVLPFA